MNTTATISMATTSVAPSGTPHPTTMVQNVETTVIQTNLSPTSLATTQSYSTENQSNY